LVSDDIERASIGMLMYDVRQVALVVSDAYCVVASMECWFGGEGRYTLWTFRGRSM
jgi:hypothetical protein